MQGHISHLPEISEQVNLASASEGDEQARALSCVFPSVQLRIKACESGHMDTRGEHPFSESPGPGNQRKEVGTQPGPPGKCF